MLLRLELIPALPKQYRHLGLRIKILLQRRFVRESALNNSLRYFTRQRQLYRAIVLVDSRHVRKESHPDLAIHESPTLHFRIWPWPERALSGQGALSGRSWIVVQWTAPSSLSESVSADLQLQLIEEAGRVSGDVQADLGSVGHAAAVQGQLVAHHVPRGESDGSRPHLIKGFYVHCPLPNPTHALVVTAQRLHTSCRAPIAEPRELGFAKLIARTVFGNDFDSVHLIHVARLDRRQDRLEREGVNGYPRPRKPGARVQHLDLNPHRISLQLNLHATPVLIPDAKAGV
mmetsp:Transcript_34425/g.53721  ORF Transcript_34425/g.53721 Transcript_34425/m.53721 type:complete len:288 (-) Transcript_34425:822-1685(-)